MNRKFRIAAVLGIVVILAVLAVVTLHQPQPAFKGKSLTYWLQGFELNNNAPGKPTLAEAQEAVVNAGTNSFPILLRMLQTKDSDTLQRLARLAQKQPFIKFHYVNADGRRFIAFQAFAIMGRVARNAVPQLVEINQAEISGAYKLAYAGNILALIKLWDRGAPAEPAKSRPTAHSEPRPSPYE